MSIPEIYNCTDSIHHKVEKLCEPVFQAFPVMSYAFEKISTDGILTQVGTHRSWLEYCGSNKLYLNNPFFSDPKNLSPGIYCSELIEHSGYRNAIRLGKDFAGYVSRTVSMISRTKTGVERSVFGLSGPAELLLFNESELLHEFQRYFRQETAEIFKRLEDKGLDLKTTRGAAYSVLPNVAPVHLDSAKRLIFLKKIFNSPSSFQFKLSEREKECARLKLDHKTAKEISFILSLSKKTVEHYLENLKSKLGVQTKAEFYETLKLLRSSGLLK